jgi:hypothetical protein
MKKITKLAAAMSLALIASNASAALDLSYTYDPEIDSDLGPSATTSSVLFAAYIADSASSNFGRTFLFDLALDGHNGLHYADFVNGTISDTSWNLNNYAEFNSYKAPLAAGKLNWAVVGASQLDQFNDPSTNQDKTNSAYSSNAQWGVAFTAHGDLNKVKAGDYSNIVQEAAGSGAIGGAILTANVSLSQLGLSTNVADTPAAGNGSYNDTQISGIGGLAAVGADAPITRGVGAADFVYVTNPAFGIGANSLTQLGTFHLGADNILSYTAFATPVPLPAGAWLFLSGLLGVLGLKRNTRAVVAG